ncbi:MAG: ABC transporter permease [Bacteroidia bacterium]|nr:ABC transporter permease [Bacteroidia bacterium]MDW8333003.1 ABC transporter permease [Bacteroidia bacterium]
MKLFLRELAAVMRREWVLEMRNGSAAASVWLYAVSTALTAGLAFREPLSARAWCSLFVLILLFVAMIGVAKSFSDETPERLRLVYQYCSPEAFVTGKMLYNALFMVVSSCLTLAVYLILLRDPGVNRLYAFGGTALSGAALGVMLTLISALAAAAGRGSTLSAVFGFPLLVPLLYAAVKLMYGAYQEVWKWREACLIAGIAAACAALSVALYGYLWQD